MERKLLRTSCDLFIVFHLKHCWIPITNRGHNFKKFCIAIFG